MMFAKRRPAHASPLWPTLFGLVLGLLVVAPVEGEAAPVPTGLAEVHREGERGPTVVLIPGLGFSWTVFKPLMAAEKGEFRFVAVTLAGFELPAGGAGVVPVGSPEDPTPWLDSAEEELRALIAEQPDGPVIVIGHSLGGHLAMRLADAPRVRGVISLDGRPVYEAPGLPAGAAPERRARQVWRVHADSIKRASDNTWLRSCATAVAEGLNDARRGRALSAEVRKRSPGMLKHAYLELLASDARPSLQAAPKTPVLIIVGAVAGGGPSDEAGVLKLWRPLVRDAPGPVEVDFIADAGHWPLDNAPNRARRRIVNFITEVAAP